MNYKIKLGTLVVNLLLATSTILNACDHSSQHHYEVDFLTLDRDFIDKQLDEAALQYQLLAKRVGADVLPKTYIEAKDSLVTSNTGWWTSGFYPGTLFYLYEHKQDTSLWAEATRKLEILEKEKDNKGTHDLGFMLYCSFGQADRLQPNQQYKDIMVRGAESLISRFNKQVGSIKSWDHNKQVWQFPVIIDNMMNLEFLNWATRYTGDPKYTDIANIHAKNTIKNHFREDHSSYHVIDYDTLSGEVRNRHTAQGFTHDSAWARGQAWGLYGFVLMYRDTKDRQYLAQAEHIADFILNHPRLPEDKIPYWDFDAENIPHAKRDASAAAIIASALLELQGYVNPSSQKIYGVAADQIIHSLSSESYKAALGTNGGFILKHSTGHLPANSEVDVPLTYADYYYVEALMRYKKLLN